MNRQFISTRQDCFNAFLNMCVCNTPKEYRDEVERISTASTLPFIDKVFLIEDYYTHIFLTVPSSKHAFAFRSLKDIEQYFDTRLESLNDALVIFEFKPTKEWFVYECPMNKQVEIVQFLLVIKRLKIDMPRDVRQIVIQEILY